MKLEDHFGNSKKALDMAQDMITSEDYDSALNLLSAAYSEVRELLDHTWRLKRYALLSESSAGKD